MAAVQRKLVHKQFNSPMGLYSQQNVKETLNRELKAFGTEGIEIDDQIARPLNLANSAVLRAVEEEEQMKCELIEPSVKCERQSRARQRFYQRPHTPVHQQQLEQIKTQYLSQQHDITIDRDTVLKINRLATRRNLHKREHSWPPIQMTTTTTTASVTNTTNENQGLEQRNFNGVCRQQQQQHIRSTSNDNALQFDETVCKRHGIDVIREKFNSPTRIIEPTPQEVRQRREQQRKLHQQQQKQLQKPQELNNKGGVELREKVVVDGDDDDLSVLKNKPKQMINLAKHQELLRKNPPDKMDSMVTKKNLKNLKDFAETKEVMEDELFKTTTIPVEKGFSHPETKAADEDIGLVEPKRQFYEQLNSYKKWHSYENLNAEEQLKPTNKPLYKQSHRRQTYSLERGREARQYKQLPPQKPRYSPKLQRRAMKLATEIKISYDADAQQHNIEVKSLKQPKKSQTNQVNENDLEHIPLPATPDKSHGKTQKQQKSVEQQSFEQQSFEQQKAVNSKETNSLALKDQQIYDDTCIYLRSIDLQDNTVAYIPAAITIVPSPTEELMQNWLESDNLKANIKGFNDLVKAKEKCENLIATENKNKKNLLQEHQEQKQQSNDKQQHDNDVVKLQTDNTYVTRLTTTAHGIHLTHQTNDNTKCKTQMSNESNKKPTNNLLMTSETAAETLKQQQQTITPGVKPTNDETKTTTQNVLNSAVGKHFENEGVNIQQQQGVYYTDGEYIYGPYDPYNGTPLSNNTIRSLELQKEQEKQLQHHHEHEQQEQIKKDIEAETKSQHKNEIANLTAKYEHIQKSINEHLKQIDSYIENAKTALKSTIATEKKMETSAPLAQQMQAQIQKEEHLKEKKHSGETPLKEILRKITNIMQEVEPLKHQQMDKQDIKKSLNTKEKHEDKEVEEGEENMPIVDKVLMDLNMLTKHLSEFDKTSSEELKPIMEQLQNTTLDLQFETRPTAATASHVLINEDKTTEITNKENQRKLNKSETVPETIPTPPPPPPPPLPTTSTRPTTTTKQFKQEKPKDHQHIAKDEKLLATDKLITAQIQSQQYGQQQQQQQLKKEMTMSALTPKDKKDTNTTTSTTTPTTTKDIKKNLVFDFITARHKQEQLVEQVIDTLGKMENETKENLVNIHVTAPDNTGDDVGDADDKKIKSNLYQQKTTTTTTSKHHQQKDMAIMQNCNISVLANDSGKDACNHDDVKTKSTSGHESQQKLHIKDFADKIADKQFQKYDIPAMMKNTNDPMVNTNGNNNKSSQRPYNIQEENIKHVTSQDDVGKDENVTNNITKNMEQPEEEGASNHSSGSELSNTYKSSYELPSPYVTMRQISWEDVMAVTQTTQNNVENEKTVLTTSVNIVKPKSVAEIAQSPLTLDEIESTTSGHVQMQSTCAAKTRIQSSKQSPQQHLPFDPKEEVRKYPAPLIEPHLPTRATSPFGLNNVEQSFKQRSNSVSPTRLATRKHSPHQQEIRKYPAHLIEPHLPTRATSPFGLNAVEMPFKQRSTSESPTRLHSLQTRKQSPQQHLPPKEEIRKYPAHLIEPHLPTRATSPFGLNAVEMPFKQRSTSESPTRLHSLQTRKQSPQQHAAPKEEIRKYPASLIEPHLPTRSTSPFGLNAVEQTFKQRSCSVSPTRLRTVKIAPDPSSLVEPHLPTRATSPFGLNAVEMKNVKRSPSTSPKRKQNTLLRLSPRTVDDMAIRKYPAPLAEPHVATRAASPFGLNPVDVFHITQATTPITQDEQDADYEDDDDEEVVDEHKDKPTSPIRKYPPALIEPHIPTRAASPFGLNAVEDTATATKYKTRHRTPSPARGHHHHHHLHSHLTTSLKPSSSSSTDIDKKPVAYVPQVEGHNIGLLVRATTPIPYVCPTDATHATCVPIEISNATKTPYDYATITAKNITNTKNSMTNDADDIERVATKKTNNGDDNGDDDTETCDELQRINAIRSNKRVKQPNMRNLNTTGTTADKTKSHQQHHHQQQQQQQYQQPQKQEHQHDDDDDGRRDDVDENEPVSTHRHQHQEQYSTSSSSGGGAGDDGNRGQHMAVDMFLLPTSVINRSFDNVSPRPYISIEGYKRVAWPPASEERIVREFTPQPQTQYQPAPAYQQQPTAPAPGAATAVPPTQGPIYNNVAHHAPQNTNNNNFARETHSPYTQNAPTTQTEVEYEAFPPQTPETPIILKDKMFSRLASQEPNPTYQQQEQQPQYQQHHQQQHYPQEQPKYQQQHQQQHYPHEQPQYQQPQQQQQYYPHEQSQYQQPQQQQHYPHDQQPQYQQEQQQNTPYYQQQPQPQEQSYNHPSGWKPIRPPQAKPGHIFTGAARETTPSVATPIYQQQFQNYHQQQQQYRAPSYDNYQQHQPQYQAQAPTNQYKAQPHAGAPYQQQAPPSQQYQQQQQQPAWAQQQQQYQQPPWVQQQQQPQYQNQSPLNQYNQAPHYQPQQQQQYPPHQQQNQFVPQTNQQQFNSYSQPQQQQHTVSHDQVDQHHQQQQPQLYQDQRGASPGIITLRKEVPITQQPAPVYTSQPAAISYRESSNDGSVGGSSMRGDLKWPPPEYKEAAAKENEERRKLALGPVCRPRKVQRDYTSFFAKNALSHHYPSYKVPPGTQHMTC